MINELITAVEAMNLTVLGDAFLTTTAIIVTIAVLGLIRYLLISFGYSKMYRKAGEAGWKAFIPIYNTYINYRISWNTERFCQYAVLSILLTAMCNSTMLSLKLASILAGIFLMVVVVNQHIKMANLFGKGTVTGIALMIFPGITSLALGLGKAEFQAEMIENHEFSPSLSFAENRVVM